MLKTKVYKYKVVSTSFNDDIYGIDIIYLQERLQVVVNMGSWSDCAHNYYIGCRATIAPIGLLLWMAAIILYIYSNIYIYIKY
jgi:hypothetical protein